MLRWFSCEAFVVTVATSRPWEASCNHGNQSRGCENPDEERGGRWGGGAGVKVGTGNR